MSNGILGLVAGLFDTDIPLYLKDGAVVSLNAHNISGFHAQPHTEIFFHDKGRFYRLALGPPIRLREAVLGGAGPRWMELDLAE